MSKGSRIRCIRVPEDAAKKEERRACLRERTPRSLKNRSKYPPAELIPEDGEGGG